MINNQDMRSFVVTVFNTYAEHIAFLKQGNLDAEDSDRPKFSTTGCKIVSEIIGVPWETTVKHIKTLAWYHYQNEDSNVNEYIQTNFNRVRRDKSESYIEEQCKKAKSWHVSLYYDSDRFFPDIDDKVKQEEVDRAGTISVFLAQVLEDGLDTDGTRKALTERMQTDAWTLMEGGELSVLYADSLKKLLHLLAQGNGGTNVVIDGKAQNVIETELFGKWAAFADIMGINAMDLLLETADKKPLLNYQGLAVSKPKNEIEDAYRNACKLCARAEMDAREDKESLGKAHGYGEALQISSDDTTSYIEALNAMLYDKKFLKMLDGEEKEDIDGLSSFANDEGASGHGEHYNNAKTANAGQKKGKNNNKKKEKKKFTPVPGQDNVRAFIDYVYRDYDGYRGKEIASLYFNYKTEKGIAKIEKAVDAYTQNVRSKQVILVYDTTVFGSADEGFLMTDKMICVHNKSESETFMRFYPQIQTITLRKRDSTYDIWLNDGEPNEVRIDVGVWNDSSNKATRLFELVRLVWKTFGPAPIAKDAKEDTEAGNTVIDNMVQPVIPAVIPTTDAQRVDESIPMPREEIGKKNQMVKCPACGEQNPPDNKFCDECGAPMEPPKEQKICPACGAVVEDDEKFCTECGAALATRKVCPNCGAEVKEGKKFCGQCGTKLI